MTRVANQRTWFTTDLWSRFHRSRTCAGTGAFEVSEYVVRQQHERYLYDREHRGVDSGMGRYCGRCTTAADR